MSPPITVRMVEGGRDGEGDVEEDGGEVGRKLVIQI